VICKTHNESIYSCACTVKPGGNPLVPTGGVPRAEGRITSIATPPAPSLKDSGERRAVSTGAVRDRAQGKGRYDLIPFFGLYSLALQLERGGIKYADRNWEKGMPLSWFADAASRHLAKFIAGFDDEPHLDAAQWNLACLAEGRERIKRGLWPAELDDLPKTYAGQSPGF